MKSWLSVDDCDACRARPILLFRTADGRRLCADCYDGETFRDASDQSVRGGQ